MEWWMILIIAFGLLVVFFCTGLPIAFSFLALDIVGLYLVFGDRGMTLLTSSIFESVASFTNSPLPLFVLLGEIFFQSRVVDIAIDAIDKWVGAIRARLHIVTLIFSIIFGAISGSGLAMTALLGKSLLPDMVRRGYDKKLSMGVILGGSTLDPLIPPSNFAVLIGMLANVSIAKLLISGIGPGLLYAALFVMYVLGMVWVRPGLAPAYPYSSSLREKMKSLIQMLPYGIIIFLVLGLMMMGFTTPTESAAIGVIAAIILVACLGRITLQMMRNSVLGAIRVSAMILLIMASSKAFSQILAGSGATRNMVSLVAGLEFSPLTIFILMQLVAFALGLFIDQISIMMITIPIYLPIIATVGFDPVWFWCLFMINMTIGGITPPFGLRLFTLQATAPETPLQQIYSASIPFVFIILVGMIFLVLFPQIVVWLPNLSAQ